MWYEMSYHWDYSESKDDYPIYGNGFIFIYFYEKKNIKNVYRLIRDC